MFKHEVPQPPIYQQLPINQYMEADEIDWLIKYLTDWKSDIIYFFLSLIQVFIFPLTLQSFLHFVYAPLFYWRGKAFRPPHSSKMSVIKLIDDLFNHS
jgi:hypothetical protein